MRPALAAVLLAALSAVPGCAGRTEAARHGSWEYFRLTSLPNAPRAAVASCNIRTPPGRSGPGDNALAMSANAADPRAVSFQLRHSRGAEAPVGVPVEMVLVLDGGRDRLRSRNARVRESGLATFRASDAEARAAFALLSAASSIEARVAHLPPVAFGTDGLASAIRAFEACRSGL